MGGSYFIGKKIVDVLLINPLLYQMTEAGIYSLSIQEIWQI